LKTLMVRERGL